MESKKAGVLNLHHWIPQKDIVKFILKKLDPEDWEIVWVAHNSKNKSLIPSKRAFAHRCARKGYFELLKWAIENGCPYNYVTCAKAAGGGHLEILKWLRENGCPWTEHACTAAAEGGHLDILKWLIENGCPWDPKYIAMRCTHAHITNWVIFNKIKEKYA